MRTDIIIVPYAANFTEMAESKFSQLGLQIVGDELFLSLGILCTHPCWHIQGFMSFESYQNQLKGASPSWELAYLPLDPVQQLPGYFWERA